jgi:hypothetical protein
MIEIHQTPTGEHTARGIAWRATCAYNARAYEATSRSGASTALARILVDAGVPDQPVQVFDKGRKTLLWPSLHAMAKWTYKEGDIPLRRVRWTPPPDWKGDLA